MLVIAQSRSWVTRHVRWAYERPGIRQEGPDATRSSESQGFRAGPTEELMMRALDRVPRASPLERTCQVTPTGNGRLYG